MDADSKAITLFTITQATSATFADLYLPQTFLCFVRSGRKRILCPVQGDLIAEEGDLIVFPPEAFVTLENRPRPNEAYKAEGIYFSHELISKVFPDGPGDTDAGGIRILRARKQEGCRIFGDLREALDTEDLPEAILAHRVLEPLIWLRHLGLNLLPPTSTHPVSQVRRLLETDLCHPWRVSEVAQHFGMSEATMRRWLAGTGHGFAKILRNARLERGLGLLQTTDLPVSSIALDCGFGTPSHFSESFRKRFGVMPKQIRSAGV